MTPWLHEIVRSIFLKVQTVWWMDIMSIRFIDSQMIYSLFTLWLLMLLGGTSSMRSHRVYNEYIIHESMNLILIMSIHHMV